MIFDLLIIGTGPAGTAAAISALKAGLKVGVVTKKPKTSPKQASPLQSIHPGVLPLLAQLGLEKIVDYSSKAHFHGISVNDQFNPLSPNEETWYGHHIDRSLFDVFLLKALKASAATVWEENQLNITRGAQGAPFRLVLGKKEEIQAHFLIDASGYQRKTKHFLDLEEYFLSPPLHCWTGVAESEAPAQRQTAFVSTDNGWVWVAPESAHRFTWTQVQADKSKAFTPPFPETKAIGKPLVHNVRWRVFRPVCTKKVILCGDAAGMLDPAAGQGILNALMSGIMAARCVVISKAQPQMEAYAFMEYDQWFIEQFEEKVEALKTYYAELNINFSPL
jgi:flavin-dependent dehydrogenase